MTKLSKYLALLFLALIVFLGLILRLRYFAQVPFPGQNVDEYSNSWVGLSLITLGYPVGNSGLTGYPFTNYHYINVDRIFSQGENAPQSINYPWFDHPPLMGLVIGGFAYTNEARVFEDTTLLIIRKPMVILSIINIFLIYLLGAALVNPYLGLIAAGIYTFSPYAIISSRVATAENGFIPLILLALLFLLKFRKTNRLIFLLLSAIMSGVSVLFKLSGVIGIIAGGLILLSDIRKTIFQKVQNFTVFAYISLSIAALFVVYGLAIDPAIFKIVLLSNANRFYEIGPHAVFDLLTQSKITGTIFVTDGWKLAGFFSLFYLLAKRKKLTNVYQFIALPIIVVILIFIIFGSFHFGWYTYPLIPLLCLAVAIPLYRSIIKNKDFVVSYLLLLLPIGKNLIQIITITDFQKFAGAWRFGLLVLTLFILLPKLSTNEQLSNNVVFAKKTLILIMFLTALLLSAVNYYLITPEAWYSINNR